MDTETKLQFVTTFTALITAAFGLVAALAWNEAIKAAVALVIKTDNGAVWGLVVYAVLVTILAVVMVIIITRSAKKLNDQIKAEKKE